MRRDISIGSRNKRSCKNFSHGGARPEWSDDQTHFHRAACPHNRNTEPDNKLVHEVHEARKPDVKPNVYSGERSGETFMAFRTELQNWAGVVHDNMLKVLELAEAKEGRTHH